MIQNWNMNQAKKGTRALKLHTVESTLHSVQQISCFTLGDIANTISDL